MSPPSSCADERVPGGGAELEHTAARPRFEVRDGITSRSEFAHGCDIKSVPRKQLKGEGAVVFELVAQCAAADDVEAVAAKLILQLAEADRFEDDDAVSGRLANPAELCAPVGRARDETGHGPLGKRLADRDTDIMAFGKEAHVERSEIAGFGYAEYAHGALLAGKYGNVRMVNCVAATSPLAGRLMENGRCRV